MRRLLLLLLTFVVYAAVAQKKSTPYVILISFDGFRHDYVQKFDPPHFKEFIRKGAAADGLIPSFPSKTFPNHYTLVTGLYPGHHGLVDNQFYDPVQLKRYGMGDRKAVLDTTFYGGMPLWQLAHKHGLKSASYFWVGSEVPLRGNYPDYYFPYNQSVPNKDRVDQTIAWLKLPEKDRPHYFTVFLSC
jgi:predicted AlkP superfamily pyrophosphatase or phosphodiesterase